MTTVLMAAMAMARQDADPKLDLELPGVTGTQLAAELSSKTGKTFVADPAMANEVVAIYVKGMPLSEVLAKVADVSYGMWVNRTAGITLISDTDRIKKEGTVSRNKALDVIRQAKTAVRAYMAGGLKFKDPEDAAQYEGSWSSPQGKVWAAMAMQIPDTVFADATEEVRTVYSTSPNAMQKGINLSGVAPLLSQWVTEQNKDTADMRKAMEDQSANIPPEMAGYMDAYKSIFGDAMTPQEIKSQPVKVLGVVIPVPKYYYDAGDEYEPVAPSLEIRVIDQAGKVILNYEAGLSDLQNIMESLANPVDPDQEGAPSNAPADSETQSEGAPLELPAEFGVYRDGFVGMTEMGDVKAPPAESVEMVIHPETYEPLKYLVGMPYVAAAKTKNKQLVAYIPDDAATNFFWNTSGKQKLGIDFVTSTIGNDDEIGKPVWTMRAEDVVKSRKERINRSDLGTFVRLSANGKTPDLESKAAFAARNQDAQDSSVLMLYRNFFQNDMEGAFTGGNNWESLIFWGLLDKGSKGMITNGQGVTLDRIPRAAQTFLYDQVFNKTVTLQTLKSMEPKPVWSNMLGQLGAGRNMGQLDEPTEMMPQGIPRNGYIKGWVKNEPYLIQLGKSGQRNQLSAPLSPEELAMVSEFMRAMPSEMTGGISEDSLNQMYEGSRTSIHLGVYLSPEKGTAYDVADRTAPDMSKSYSMNNLPKDFEAQLNQVKASMKDSKEFQLMVKFLSGIGSMGMGEKPVIKP